MNDLFLAMTRGDMKWLGEDLGQTGAWKILISYHYFKDVDLDVELGEASFSTHPRVFADCGAFSAFTQDMVIDIHEYAEWALKWAHHFTVTASLDVIGSADASHENFETLKRLGVDCIPVFHVGDPWELLDHYAETEPYIALGGMVGNPDTNRFIDDCFARTEGTGVGFHGFGMTKLKQMMGYPWRSVDSSSWIAARFGQTFLFDPGSKRFVKIQSKTKDCLAHIPLILDHDGDPKLLYDSTQSAFRRESAKVSATAWRRFEETLMGDSEIYLVSGTPMTNKKSANNSVFGLDWDPDTQTAKEKQ